MVETTQYNMTTQWLARAANNSLTTNS